MDAAVKGDIDIMYEGARAFMAHRKANNGDTLTPSHIPFLPYLSLTYLSHCPALFLTFLLSYPPLYSCLVL